MSGSENGPFDRLGKVATGAEVAEAYAIFPHPDHTFKGDLRFALSRIASLETALKERTAELKIATGALQADGRFAETVKVLTDVLDEYDSEEG